MSTYPSPVPKPDLFEFYSRKLRAICELHNIKTGPGQTLDGFLAKLDSDRHFAMDFWGLVGKLSSREGGDLNDDQMVALLVAVVTGGPFTALTDPDSDPAVALLRAMLSGVDVQRTEPARSVPVSSIDDARPKLTQIDESRARRFYAGLASVARSPDPDPFPATQTSPPSTPDESIPPSIPASSDTIQPLPAQLQLALQSLELVSRDMNDHVQKIDQRLVRMETQTRKIIARTEALGGPALRGANQTANNQGVVADPAMAMMRGERRMFETFPSLRDVHWKQNVTIGVVLLSLIAGGITWRYYSPWLLLKLHQFVREDLEAPERSLWGQKHRDAVLLPPPVSSAQTPRQPPAPRTLPTTPQPTEEDRAQTTSAPSTSPTEPDPVRAEQDIARLASVVVSEYEMDQYLVNSRVPAYPDDARAARLRGSVVAQALISKDGTVSRVHVIEGDPRLRAAATEAIYKRRYRPYFYNGRPVDVATTITINFRPGGSHRS